MTWLRTDSANRTLSRERTERHPALPRDEIPFTLEPVVTQLEDDYWRVTRYGVEGRVSRFHWGYVGTQVEHPVSGGTPEGRGLGREYAIWTSTVLGVHGIPTDELQILGPHFGTKKDCASHGPGFAGSCKKTDPRLTVQFRDAGPVVMCVAEMTARLIPHTQLHDASTELGESWMVTRDRAQELIWNRAGAAQRGEPLRPLADAWAEMIEGVRTEKEHRSARKRRVSGGQRKGPAVVAPTLNEITQTETAEALAAPASPEPHQDKEQPRFSPTTVPEAAGPPSEQGPSGPDAATELPIVDDDFSLLFAADRGLLRARTASDGAEDRTVHLAPTDGQDGVVADADTVRRLVDEEALRFEGETGIPSGAGSR